MQRTALFVYCLCKGKAATVQYHMTLIVPGWGKLRTVHGRFMALCTVWWEPVGGACSG